MPSCRSPLQGDTFGGLKHETRKIRLELLEITYNQKKNTSLEQKFPRQIQTEFSTVSGSKTDTFSYAPTFPKILNTRFV